MELSREMILSTFCSNERGGESLDAFGLGVGESIAEST